MIAHSTPKRRLRDVPDVDAYVSAAVEHLGPGPSERHSALHAHGVRAVLRVERALPPGVPLLPVLDSVLPPRLAALDLGFSNAGALAAAA